jgi:L-proline amide hydrolase
MVGEGHKIEARTLLINGWRDIASDKAVAPFFREIPKIKWVKFMNSTHSPQFEEEERFMEVVGEFLTDD